MKKVLSFSLAAMLSLGAFAAFPVANAVAEETATETKTIRPMAAYEFDDVNNPGLDSSGNGFNLTKKVVGASADAFKVLEDTDGENYISLSRTEDGSGGGFLYAPELGNSGKDFSDLIEESYTVSLTFRRDNSSNNGSHYVLATGRYNKCFQITPWLGGIEIQLYTQNLAPGATAEEQQQWIEQNTKMISGVDTSDWTTVTVSTDSITNISSVYINGEIRETFNLTDVSFTWREDNYTFTLGAQCQVSGNAATQFATVDIKQCRVYDCALSEANVARLYNGQEAILEEGTAYIQEAAEIDTSALDLYATDVNTVDVIMNEVLPTSVMTTISNGMKMPAKITWFPVSDTQIAGYLHSLYANVDQIYKTIDYGYTVRFDYDETLVRIGSVKLDGNAYEPGTPIDQNLHNVSFTVTPLNEFVEINAVSYLDMEWEPAENEYYISVVGGAHVYIDASAITGTVTYYDGEEKLGTSKYSYGGNEKLKTYDKEGYEFVGWFADEELTTAVTELDYTNPVDITLYAKYKKISASGNGSEGGKKGGCGSVIGVSFAALTALAAGFVVFSKRK